MSEPIISAREVPQASKARLEAAGVHPLLARLYASRGVESEEELDESFTKILPPLSMLGMAEAAVYLADAILAQKRICIIADYDCDGATSCAIAMRGFTLLGVLRENLHYVVPDRAVHGYGLSPSIVDLALQEAKPDVLVTVDNGIASIEGVAYARAKGLDVVVTDHHLPAVNAQGQLLTPEANVVVNPNQVGCQFESKNLAGCGVIFYVMVAVRAELRKRGHYATQPQPRLDALLDLVALGTIADVVKLDANNRRLVAQGLRRIRLGQACPGVQALFAVVGKNTETASGFDFGFGLAPRINAAGRLADMSLGIECLITDDPVKAHEMAMKLNKMNVERREIESGMREQAEALLNKVMPAGELPSALAIWSPDFHEGVVGIVSSRLKDKLHRPTFVFAQGHDGVLKGSGRSIPGFHLRDALDLVSKRHPGVLVKFGGHAMAAGATVRLDQFDTFNQAFQQVAKEWLTDDILSHHLLTDGPLEPEYFNAEAIRELDSLVWGQAFEAPRFCNPAEVLDQSLIKDAHLKVRVRMEDHVIDGIWFGRTEPLPQWVRLVYKLNLNEWNGRVTPQLMVEAATPL